MTRAWSAGERVERALRLLDWLAAEAPGLDPMHVALRVDEVRELATLVVVTRPGFDGSAAPPGWPCIQVEVPRLEVSSTDLRARFTDGRPLDWLVTEPVVRLIRERGLYGPRG